MEKLLFGRRQNGLTGGNTILDQDSVISRCLLYRRNLPSSAASPWVILAPAL